MSTETTPAIERAANAVRDVWASASYEEEAQAALTAALDVEEMARVLYAAGAWCGVCEFGSWNTCRDCRETVRGYATTLRTAILGGDS